MVAEVWISDLTYFMHCPYTNWAKLNSNILLFKKKNQKKLFKKQNLKK